MSLPAWAVVVLNIVGTVVSLVLHANKPENPQ